MSEGINPFQSPSTQSFGRPRTAPPWLLARVRIPSICLICLTTLSLLHRIADLVLSIFLLTGQLPFPGRMPGQMHTQLQMAVVVDSLSILTGLAMLVGSWQMLQDKSYAFSLITAVLAVIPRLSPCLVLGIPFGIWALIVLADEQTKANFL